MSDGIGFEAPFLGLRPAAFDWIDGITASNTKDWFTEHRDQYDVEVKGPLLRLLEEAAAELGGTSKVFRQNRDVRFSKDKSPYKTNTYGVVTLSGHGTFGLYVSINREGVTAGTGMYDMAKDQLERFRVAVVDPESGPAFVEAAETVAKNGIALSGDALKTAPRGFPKDHPRIEYIRLKQVLLMSTLSRAKATDGRAALDHALQTWKNTQPVVSWLGAHVGPSQVPPEARRR
ncbi:MAG: DUF2461 domain-containing protein [Pseudomonadota bacterium]